MLAEAMEAKRRLEILTSDASAREMRMLELKREVNDLLNVVGKEPRYGAPARLDAFLAGGEQPSPM